MAAIFRRTVHLGDTLNVLAGASFIRLAARQEPVQPDAAYLNDAALATFKRAAELQPGSALAWNNRGVVLNELGVRRKH